MNRQQKEVAVSQVKDLFQKSQAAFLVNYKGVTVESMQKLRRGLRQNDALLRVTKARLMKIAAQDVDGAQPFKEDFKNQVGLVFALQEVPSVAKTLIDFAQDEGAFDIVSGLFEAKCLSQDQIKFLAALPPREVLLGQVVGTLQAPVSSLACLLQMMMIRLLVVLKQVAEKQQ